MRTILHVVLMARTEGGDGAELARTLGHSPSGRQEAGAAREEDVKDK